MENVNNSGCKRLDKTIVKDQISTSDAHENIAITTGR